MLLPHTQTWFVIFYLNSDGCNPHATCVIMAEGDDDMEVNGPEDIPPDEDEDEELGPASDEDGGEIFDTDSEDDA